MQTATTAAGYTCHKKDTNKLIFSDYETGHTTADIRGLNPVPVSRLLAHEFAPPESVLGPFLPTKGLAIIHAPRGTGKTHVAKGIGCAVVAGTPFLR